MALYANGVLTKCWIRQALTSSAKRAAGSSITIGAGTPRAMKDAGTHLFLVPLRFISAINALNRPAWVPQTRRHESGISASGNLLLDRLAKEQASARGT